MGTGDRDKTGEHMKKGLMIGAALAAGLLLSSCLQVNTTISVNPDGSGTVEQKVLMKSEMMAMMAGLSSMGQDSKDGSDQPAKPFSLFDRDQLAKDAAKMGAGVQLKSAEPIKNDFGEGYRAVYSFSDITKVQVNQNPGDTLPSQMQSGNAESSSSNTPDYVRFAFRRGSPSVLTITFPTPPKEQSGSDKSADNSSTDKKMTEQDLAMVTQFYQDMRITTDVVLNGNVVGSNASYRDGNRITLLDFQFNQLLANPDFKTKLMEGKSSEMGNFQNLGKTFPGLKIETRPTVEVRFR